MSEQEHQPTEDEQWAAEVPERVPYFDPAGFYRCRVCVQIDQVGRVEEQNQPPGQGQGPKKKEFQKFNQPIECYSGEVDYKSLPVDGVNIAAIVLLKAQEAIQALGMVVRTPMETDPKYQAMLAALNRPAISDEEIEALCLAKKSAPS